MSSFVEREKSKFVKWNDDLSKYDSIFEETKKSFF